MIRKAGLTTEEGLRQLKQAGMDAIPGGGAEIFDARLRQRICPEKGSTAEWLGVHEAAHRLGIPTNAVMALMIGDMMIHEITPGPQVMNTDPELFWGLIVSMWIGNLILIVLNLPMIGVWVQLLRVPYRWLYPAILAFCCIGVYSINNNVFDVWMTIGFGALGYLFNKLGCESAPLILGFILGPMMEENMRRALLLSRGDMSCVLTSPLSAAFLALSVLLLLLVLAPAVRSGRETAFRED